MNRFRVSVLGLPRDRFEQAVRIGVRVLEEGLPDAGREKPGPGVEYLSPDELTLVRVTAWDPDVEHAARLEFDDGLDFVAEGSASLSSVGRPRVLRVSGGVMFTGLRWFRGWGRVDFALELDLERWWAAAGPLRKAADRRRGAPLTGRVTHRVGAVAFRVTPAADGTERWRITLELAPRGRGVFRVPVAVAARVFRRRIRGGIETGLAEMAGEWDEEMAELARMTPEELYGELAADLAESLAGDEG
ncbi:hypothetical protein SRB5_61330 [Streptomyces sp. RB5]|uniref:DUF1990 domain-containing protein n=1 Tax=Streptomyces smaragdinus TaxID=2585196 RepID=A0A7K0CR94_9ACTN|nr:hypothetical protein [Streptomyces smaragdinus]MQY15941.1 hypothetical protein [Streptomyces smaragdinus]